MKKLYEIKVDNDYIINKKVINFLNPEYVCILLSSFDNIENLKKVNKNKLIESTNLLSYSSVSGVVEGIAKINIDNKEHKALFIKNDFYEKDTKFKIVNIDSVLSLLNFLKKTKYFEKLNKENGRYFVVNGIMDEPYADTESFLLKNLSDQLIETISLLDKLFNFEKSYITFKNIENDNISAYLSKTGSYPKMNIIAVENKYLISKEEFLLKKLELNIKETIVLKPSEILEIRNFLKFNCFKTEKCICVVDTINKKIKYVNVKKNSFVSELLNKLKLISNDYIYIKNGLMSGCEINYNKEIITEDFDALFILKKEKTISKKCINCGKCSSICPYGINPKEVIKKGIKDSRCSQCGLCTYFCPSQIDLNELLERIKK